jgi:hypothetical protein
MASISTNVVTDSTLTKCPKLTDKDNYIEWSEIMQSNLITADCWDIVNGNEEAPVRPEPFYISQNRFTGVNTLHQAETEYGRRVRGVFVYDNEACKDCVQEIKDQILGYEAHIRLREKAKNLMINNMTKDLWYQ